VIYPPANDPFVITVGAVDDKGTGTITDDKLASFSASGNSEDGAVKPDLVAPGKNITARLVNQNMGWLGRTLPTRSAASISGCRELRWPPRWFQER